MEERILNGTGKGVLPFSIVNATKGVSGTYTCRALNGTILQQVWLSVIGQPRFVEKPVGQIFFAARTIRVYCWVEGNVTVQWLKDGVPVHINGTYLELDDVRKLPYPNAKHCRHLLFGSIHDVRQQRYRPLYTPGQPCLTVTSECILS